MDSEFPKSSEQIQIYKHTPEGEKSMSAVSDEIRADERRQIVITLHRKGNTATEISEMLDMPLAEVEGYLKQ